MRKIIIALLCGWLGWSMALAASAPHPPSQNWKTKGLLGKVDKQAAQRGLQVYKEVCAVCHGLRLVSFRHLGALGYDASQIKAFAAEFEINDGPNEDGENFTRAGIPSDFFPDPYANEVEARLVNNGALPPDLSLIVKARAHGSGNFLTNLRNALSGHGSASGSDYLYALLTGYKEPPADMVMQEGASYNEWFAGGQISMPPPLADGLVEYSDGTEATIAQTARDVTVFLAWASEPELEARRSLGIKIIAFLLVMFGLALAAKRSIWSRIEHR